MNVFSSAELVPSVLLLTASIMGGCDSWFQVPTVSRRQVILNVICIFYF